MTMPGVAAASLSLVKNAGRQIDRNCVDCILHGVTTVRDQMGRQPSLLGRQQRIARGELMGPRILRGIAVDVPHGYMTSYGIVMKDGGILAGNVAEARDAVAKAVDFGADHIKVAMQYTSLFQGEKPIPLMTDEMFAAVVEKAASLGKTVAVHHTSIEGFRRALKAGIQSFEHMPSDLPLTDQDIRQFIDKRRAVVPTGSVAWALAFPLSGDENFNNPFVQKIWKDKQARITSVITEYAIPSIAKVGAKTYKTYASPGYFDRKHRMITPSARMFNAAGAIGGANMMKMYSAGCRLGCGNDGGIPFVWPGSLPLEMFLNQEAGMKPGDVLRSATAINAEIIGMEKSLGTLDPGKIADLVILDANPLETMENMGKLAAVLQAGRLVFTRGNVKET
jgi:imidazolonepropionase-like amidohydrolase